jgi:hypothetical protein
MIPFFKREYKKMELVCSIVLYGNVWRGMFLYIKDMSNLLSQIKQSYSAAPDCSFLSALGVSHV